MLNSLDRRRFLASAGLGATLLATAGAADEPMLKGKADSCIFIWLGGGASHVDTWDPKRKGDPKAKQAGSYYDPIDTTVKGVQVCEHLKESAKVMDRMILLRSVNHDVIDEHAAAVNRMHTGRPGRRAGGDLDKLQ